MRSRDLILTVIAALSLAGVAFGFGAVRSTSPATLNGGIVSEPFTTAVDTLTPAIGPISLSSHDGNVRLLFFGYPNCPDIRPTTLARLAAAKRQLSPAQADTTQVITIDPEKAIAADMRTIART